MVVALLLHGILFDRKRLSFEPGKRRKSSTKRFPSGHVSRRDAKLFAGDESHKSSTPEKLEKAMGLANAELGITGVSIPWVSHVVVESHKRASGLTRAIGHPDRVAGEIEAGGVGAFGAAAGLLH